MVDVVSRAFVIGHPIAHSRSPLIHGTWLKRHGLPGSYEAVDVEPDDLAGFFNTIRAGSWIGGNVTIPHKYEALKLVDHLTEPAQQIGAVNTVFRDRETGELTGHNTDAEGFARNLDDQAPEWRNSRTALVLGAGGAAPAIVWSLLNAGYKQIDLVNRSRDKAEAVEKRFGTSIRVHDWDSRETCVAGADLIVNTTALGMSGKQELAMDLDAARPGAIATDIVYTPLVTSFLRQAEARGLHKVTGLGMLLHQAVPGFERWFGVRPEVDAKLHELVLADINRVDH